jgi:uncharacterized repeat protein (TIGR01451 family)
MMHRIGIAGLLVAVLLALLCTAQQTVSLPAAQTVYVDPSNGNDATGTGSLSAPWRSIRRALQAVVTGDTINALAGTYSTATGETFPINFPPGVKLVGAGRDNTFISGQSDQAVIYINGGSVDIMNETVISGVTLRNGSVGLILRGVNGQIVSPAILDVRISQNRDGLQLNMGTEYADQGATIAPIISNTEVISNNATGIALNVYTFGNPSSAKPSIVNSVIRGNGSHGISLNAISPANTYAVAAPHVINSQISHNGGHGISAVAGGYGSVAPHIERSWLNENTGFGFYWGGYVGTLDAVITNTVITRNGGGGIFFDVSSTIRIVHSVVADNQQYGIYWKANSWIFSQPQIVNSIIWNRGADDLYATGRDWTIAEVQYSNVEDGDFNGQSGNFSADPLLADDYHIGACSPAMNAGTGANTAPTDLDGESRPLGSAPDVGADEYEAPCALQVHKAVSSANVRLGELVTYTIRLINTMPITALNVMMTDVLPSAISYQLGSLQASHGIAQYENGAVTWQDVITPNETATIRLTGKVNLADTSIFNHVIADAGAYGRYASPTVATTVDPTRCYLPLVYRNYCGGPFTDNFSNPASGWPIAETTYWSYGYTGGEYRFYAKRSAFGAVSRGDQTGRFIVEVDARQVSAVNGSLGIVFQVNDDWSHLFTFEIYPETQQWALFEFIGNQWHLRAYGASSAIQPGQSTNRLRVAWAQQTVVTDDYGLYVNGQQVFYLSYITAPTPVRRVGLTATSDGAGFDVRFDNYKFVAEGCPEFAANHLTSTVVTPNGKPSPDQLSALWQGRLQAKNSLISPTNQGKLPLSDWER